MVWYFGRIIALILVSLLFVIANGQAMQEIVAKKVVSKQEVPPSNQDLAIIDYQQALKLLEDEQEIEATMLLKKAIERAPRMHKARMQLVEVYRKIGWTDQIEKLLQSGIDLAPEHPDFIKELALLYFTKQQPRKALSILLTMPAEFAGDIDYLGLLALSYLKTEQYEVAAKNYGQLLKIDQKNANWWLGLGICLDAVANQRGAKDSFERARDLGRYTPEVLDYINQKLAVYKRS